MQAEINGLMMAKKNSAVLWTVDQHTNDSDVKAGRKTAQKNIGITKDTAHNPPTGKLIDYSAEHKFIKKVTWDDDNDLTAELVQPSLADITPVELANKNWSVGTNSSDGTIETQDLTLDPNTDVTTYGNGTTYVSSVAQASNGKVTYKTQTITVATDEQEDPTTHVVSSTKGITALCSDTLDSNHTVVNTNTVAVTPKGLKTALTFTDSKDQSVVTNTTTGEITTKNMTLGNNDHSADQDDHHNNLSSNTMVYSIAQASNGKVTYKTREVSVDGTAITIDDSQGHALGSQSVVTDANGHLTTENMEQASPTASGNTNAFIADITQSKTGKISAYKKTLAAATSTSIGGIKTDFSNLAAERKYKVELDANSNAFVQLPLATVNTAGIVPLINDITDDDGTIVTNKEDHAVTPLGVKSAIDTYVYSVDNALSTTSENPVQNKVITAALNGKVDSTDSRLAYDADVLIAVYTTQASGTTLEELRTAYHAGKKIYVKIGGSIGSDSYEELIPLSYVRNSVVNNESVIVGFYFESQIDPVLNEGQAGTMITYYRDSGGWSYKLGYVYYAESSGESNQANYAKGYVEGEGIAQALAGRMNTTANNAATEALDNLMTNLDSPSSADVIADLTTTMAVSYNGTNWKQLRPGTLWNYINSKVSAAGYAKRPRIAFLDAPQYYQEGATVEYVEVYDKNTSIWPHQGYQILGNKSNSSSNWGVCHVPTNVDYSKGYCEIDFDLQLWSYRWTGSEIEAYANLDMPYIINFVATTGSNDGASPSMIALDDSKIFATQALSIDCRRGTTASFAHVRLCGRMQSSTSANHAIYIGAQTANDWSVLITRTKMANVRIKYYDDVASMT